MTGMNTWDHSWALDPVWCPCDLHLTELLEARAVSNATIFHFGTGAHHHVGLHCADGARGNVAFGVTASREEYDAYVRLVAERPSIARSYVVYFGDIYLLNPRLVPSLDIATLFHLCEFRTDKNAAYGGLSDAQLLDAVNDCVRPGGWLVFYERSCAFELARSVIAEAEQRLGLERVEQFQSLIVYKKPGAVARVGG